MEHAQSAGTAAGLLLAGRYRLTESIGRGGMGKVWRAQDEVLHRTVAVKELTAGLYVSEADRTVLHARTQKEARAAARISHPNVVTVHDVLEYDGRPWIVMQYVDGPSLADAAKESGRIQPAEAARIGLHVLGALRAAHAAGVLHRDVKPGNVLLASDGRVLLTDFGIAAIEGDSTITRTGELVGSIDYLAPERVRGSDPGPASDLWSLGATLYSAVEGNSPFRRTSPLSTMQAVVTEEHPPAPHAGALEPVISALLRKEPEHRPPADEAERMLLEAVEGRRPRAAQAYVPTRAVEPEARWAATAPLTGPTPAPVPATSAPKRSGVWRRALLVAVLAAVAGGGAGFLALRYGTGGGSPTTDDAGFSAPSAGSTPKPADGEKWRRVRDPEGFSLLVPEGWARQRNGDQIDYTPDNGRRLIRISIDATPDFENPYMHMLDVEKTVRKRLPEYERVRLDQNTFRDQENSALWEFTWTETKNNAGERRAIDQVYYGDDGTEYALYMSSPAEEWATTRQHFDRMVQSFAPSAG
ncbi:serine/threonine-protein kinase [Streptomyces marianii]|uniref:non-specific serine/threonine protein kinase n=1 Tax=Streptomyces marianii TaxID=1817406 RepID=A0A5R9E875_9ACTN|nr:serine/threonine-protein kinase [Streptomyces marianii]TLQ44213.1 serine/threonine protein kinase [Streptomyces marianii]